MERMLRVDALESSAESLKDRARRKKCEVSRFRSIWLWTLSSSRSATSLPHPDRHCIQKITPHVRVVSTGPLEHMKRVIRLWKQLERRALAQFLAERLQQLEFGKL